MVDFDNRSPRPKVSSGTFGRDLTAKLPDKIIAVIEHAIGTNVSAIVQLQNHTGKNVYVINDLYILKVSSRIHGSHYGEVSLLLGSNGIPCPLPIKEWIEDGKLYQLETRISGDRLDTLDDPTCHSSQLASLLEKIHSIEASEYGAIRSDGLGKTTTWAPFINRFNKYEASHKFVVPTLVSVTDYEKVKEIVASLANRDFKPRLLHGDFLYKNIIRQYDGQLVAIDWDTSIAGDVIMELAWIKLWDKQFVNAERLLRDYKPPIEIDRSDLAFYLPRYQVFSAFITLNNLVMRGSSELYGLPSIIKRRCYLCEG